MHPAFSVIFLTTLIGAGQGLFLALYTGQLYSVVEVVPVEDSHAHYGMGALIAMALLIAGLFSSFFHLVTRNVPGAPVPAGAPPGCLVKLLHYRPSWA